MGYIDFRRLVTIVTPVTIVTIVTLGYIFFVVFIRVVTIVTIVTKKSRFDKFLMETGFSAVEAGKTLKFSKFKPPLSPYDHENRLEIKKPG